MKTFIQILALSFILTSVSEAALRGYLVETRSDLSFQGIADDGTDGGFSVTFMMGQGAISKAEYKMMTDCQKKKETHAILVESKTVRTVLPGINGSRQPNIDLKWAYEIDCVKAPGFLNYWRKFYNAGPAN